MEIKSPANKPKGSASPWRGTGPVIESAPLPIVEVQGKEHRVTFVNTAFCGLVGKTRTDLLGLPFAQIVPGGEKCVEILDRVFASGEAATHVYEDRSAAHPAFWMYAMWPRLDASKQPAGVIIHMTTSVEFHDTAVAINEALLIAGLRQHELTGVAEKLNVRLEKEIAERKTVEIALRAAVKRLKRAKEHGEIASTAKDNFLAALSHELRTPLTPVLLAAATLREDPRLPADLREQLTMIERNVALEARLIDDLLDLTKIAHGKLQFQAEPCDAHQLINYAVDIVRDDAEAKNLRIERSFAARHSRLVADPARVQQVIWNLLGNAVKFTPNGGKIAVRTRDIKASTGKNWIRIEIADTGLGIDPEKLEQIFLPFEQGGTSGSSQFGGMGLGLAISRGVVDLHGGRLFAQSPGANLGSTFVIELPAAAELAPKAPDPGAISHGSKSPIGDTGKPPSRHLLLVDDHEATLKTLAGLLRNDGHDVATATTIVEALTAAAARKFDLVISDLGLPDGSGLELMEKLRELYGLKGIALTGYGSKEDVARSHGAGFVTHLVKPVSIAGLRQAIAAFPLSGPSARPWK
ncbi:MAG: hypothetical protein JWM35_589 [Verrucomicrobia bacterium]|nr:hypothetical protein [Verrucomicrobiota bacterium]